MVLEWVFIIAGVIASFALESSLPEPLATWLSAEAGRDLTAREIALFVVFVPLIVCFIVSTVGLLCLRRWAAWLYLGTTAFGTLLMPFTGPTVEHAFAATLDEIGLMMAGAVIALAFFTDSLERSAEPPPPPLPRAP
jgi:hypothetical protein